MCEGIREIGLGEQGEISEVTNVLILSPLHLDNEHCDAKCRE